MHLWQPLLLCVACVLALPACAKPSNTQLYGVVLTYHHVATDTPASTSVRPQQFIAHLDAISNQGYTVWPLQQLVEDLQNNKPVPAKTIAISFDDAYASILQHAHPALTAKGMPYTIFVSTAALTKPGKTYLSWQALRELRDAGVGIGNHSHSHAHLLARNPGETTNAWRQRMVLDIQTAQQNLHQQLGQNANLFAYPYGEYSSELAMLVRELGLIGFSQQSGAIGPANNFAALPRFALGGNYSDLRRLQTALTSKPLPVNAIPNGPSVIQTELGPSVVIEISPGPFDLEQLACYASGQGAMKVEQLKHDHQFRITPTQPMAIGRSKYNCTAPATGGSAGYFWWSHLVMRLQPDGLWYRG